MANRDGLTTPEDGFEAGMIRVRDELLEATSFYARQAKSTPHKMHVDDHRGKAARLSESAAEIERIRRSFAPAVVHALEEAS